MSEPIVKRGDVVLLKSGGPRMTVYDVRDDDHVEVEWFVGEEIRRDAFQRQCLRVEQWIEGTRIRFVTAPYDPAEGGVWRA